MCSSRINPVWILRAFFNGADGILVAGCHPKDCHYTRGNFYTRRRLVLLKDIFETLDLEEERIRLSWISASEGLKYSMVVKDFTDLVKKKGHNPTRSEIFL
jgi:F420-non-reducing hydrogenase iron-sulfur subunit